MPKPNSNFDLRELFTSTTVGELTLTHVPVLGPDASVAEAATAMREVSHGSALVCEDDRLTGIITERDLLRLLAEDDGTDRPLTAVMTTEPKSVSVDDCLLDAVRWMDQGGYRRLPVVDAQRHPVGVIDVKTVVNFLVDQVPSTVYNQAAAALLSVREREGA